MKELTDQDENEILDLFLGMYFFQFLASAVELDLFTLLSASPGLTREEIAERLELENQPARILLLGCGAVGLLRKEGDRYFNTSGAERSSPENSMRFCSRGSSGSGPKRRFAVCSRRPRGRFGRARASM